MKGKIKLLKITSAVLVCLVIAAATIYLWPYVVKLGTIEGQQEFEQIINDSGIVGLVMITAIQFAQIFLFIIPGEPIEILAGICYGGILGTVFILCTCALITAFIYFLVKRFGNGVICEFVGKEKMERIQNSKIFQNSKVVKYTLFILFFIPGTPKDFLTYIAALLPIKPLEFILITTIARVPSVISSTFAGQYILKGNWLFSLLAYGITFFVVAIVGIVFKILDKGNVAKEAIDTIK